MFDKLSASVRRYGFGIEKNYLSTAQVSACREELQAICNDVRPQAHLLKSPNSIHIHNFFLYGNSLRKTLFGPELRRLHLEMFGKEYCLRNAVASNIQELSSGTSSRLKKPIGAGWHRDTPQFNNQQGVSRVLGPGLTFQVIIALDESSSENCTKVISESHLSEIAGHRLPLSESANIAEHNLILNPGDIAVIDDNVFHRAGEATPHSRWVLFCSYTPWFVKPYFDFASANLPDLSDYEAHCLHRNARPPHPEEALRNTLLINHWDELI